MNISKIHFIREVVVTDHRGKETPTMQFSYDNASYLHPTFLGVPSADQEQVRALYLELGGGREEDWDSGSTVIIPQRSRWASLWPISVKEVQVMASAGRVRPSRHVPSQRPGTPEVD